MNLIFDRCGTYPKDVRDYFGLDVGTGPAPSSRRVIQCICVGFDGEKLEIQHNQIDRRKKIFSHCAWSQLYIGAPKKKPVSDKHGNCHNSLQLPSYAVEPATKSYKAIMCPMATLQKVSTCNYFSSKGVADCGCECCETFLHQQTLPLKPKGHFLGVGKSVSHNKLGDYPLVRGH